jgi:hypothetical protein
MGQEYEHYTVELKPKVVCSNAKLGCHVFCTFLIQDSSAADSEPIVSVERKSETFN